MPRRAKSDSSSSILGRSVIRKRFSHGSRPKDNDTRLHTTDMNDGAKWTHYQSITELRDLDDFLATAELAGTEFTAEKQNVTVVTNDYASHFVVTEEREQELRQTHATLQDRLTVPRRPKWTKETTPEELHRLERESFLEWRRNLSVLQETEDLIMTPFEKNIEVWRQLWRVIERSDVIVQIVDARNPLMFRSVDLETYVKELDAAKVNLLLVNKSDMLSVEQRLAWAKYFDAHGIKYAFFSAALAQHEQAAEREAEALSETVKDLNVTEDEVLEEYVSSGDDEWNALNPASTSDEQSSETDQMKPNDRFKRTATPSEYYDFSQPVEQVPESCRILGSEGLLSLLRETCHRYAKPLKEGQRWNIGLVGYPNVGKSSTINATLGAKVVAVAATPGKTKHFQTILLDDDLCLCDCPGLVFPSFAVTRAELVVNGVLPIDQLREFSGPATLVAQRIPRPFLESTYGISLPRPDEHEIQTRPPTASELLSSYAAIRGFMRSVQGNPDESRAARIILKDYVSGKLLYCHPPPETVSGEEFNLERYTLLCQMIKARGENTVMAERHRQVPLTHTVDSEFFQGHVHRAHTIGKQRANDFARVVTGQVALVGGEMLQPQRATSKKHFKMNKRAVRIASS